MHNNWGPAINAQYRPGGPGGPTTAVIQAVATAAGTDPTDLAPLYEAIDTEAPNRLFAEHQGVAGAGAVLSLTVDTWNVFVRADGHIRVYDATQPTDPEPVFEGQSG